MRPGGRHRQDIRPSGGCDVGIREDQPERPCRVSLGEDARFEGMREDQRRTARQGGQQGGQETRPILDADANRFVSLKPHPKKGIPDTCRKVRDLPERRTRRREAAGPVFQKRRDLLVHQCPCSEEAVQRNLSLSSSLAEVLIFRCLSFVLVGKLT